MADPRLRQALEAKEFILAPGVFDLISAPIADRLDFKALYVTGYETVASYLGLPDAGIATYRDMIEPIGQIVKMTTKPSSPMPIPVTAAFNVRHTIRGYEAAGVTAIQIEDQEFPKKCGHTPNRRVIPIEDIVRKVRVASDSRSSADFLIIARTNARTSLGLDEALRQGEAYRKAGADIVFIESPESEAGMKTVSERIDAPLFANMVNGGRTPLLSAERLKQLGYSIAIHPAVGFLSVGAALDKSYRDLAANGITSPDIDLYSFAEFNKLLGFEDVWAFEKKYAEI